MCLVWKHEVWVSENGRAMNTIMHAIMHGCMNASLYASIHHSDDTILTLAFNGHNVRQGTSLQQGRRSRHDGRSPLGGTAHDHIGCFISCRGLNGVGRWFNEACDIFVVGRGVYGVCDALGQDGGCLTTRGQEDALIVGIAHLVDPLQGSCDGG